MDKTLIYRKETGEEIRVEDTLTNRFKATIRGYKLTSVINLGKISKAKGGKL